jgi:hypothetical protein
MTVSTDPDLFCQLYGHECTNKHELSQIEIRVGSCYSWKVVKVIPQDFLPFV